MLKASRSTDRSPASELPLLLQVRLRQRLDRLRARTASESQLARGKRTHHLLPVRRVHRKRNRAVCALPEVLLRNDKLIDGLLTCESRLR